MSNESEKIERRINDLKRTIEVAKKKVAESEGSLKTLFSRLEKEFGVTTLEEASEKYSEMKKEEEQVTAKLEKEYKKLEENYDW